MKSAFRIFASLVAIVALLPAAMAKDNKLPGVASSAAENISKDQSDAGTALNALDSALGLLPSELILSTIKGNVNSMVSTYKKRSLYCETPPCRSVSPKGRSFHAAAASLASVGGSLEMCETPPCVSRAALASGSSYDNFCETPPCRFAASKVSECEGKAETSGMVSCFDDWCKKNGNSNSPFCREWKSNFDDKSVVSLVDFEKDRAKRMKTYNSHSGNKIEGRYYQAVEDARAARARATGPINDGEEYHFRNAEHSSNKGPADLGGGVDVSN